VRRPDVLLLDEPTNHLDLDSIEWLEDLLLDFPGSVVLITHDRTFLDRVATRIVELDRGRCAPIPATSRRYQATKEEQLARSRDQRQGRQAAGAGGSLDPQGRGGAPHALAKPHRPAERLRARRADRRDALGRVSSTSPPAARAARSSRSSTGQQVDSARRTSCATSPPPSCAATRSA
jgi:ATP-binding cassette subfamily F protein uup